MCPKHWLNLCLVWFLWWLHHVPVQGHLCQMIRNNRVHRIKVQALTRSETAIYLIEGDNLYEITEHWSISSYYRMSLMDHSFIKPIPTHKWSTIYWLIPSADVTSLGVLQYFALYSFRDSKIDSLRNIIAAHYKFADTQFIVDNQTKALIQHSFFTFPPQAQGELSTVVNGHNSEGYAIQYDQNRRVAFYDLESLLENIPNSNHHYFYALTTRKGGSIVFLHETQKRSASDSKNDLFVSLPFGFIEKNRVFLLDFVNQMVYSFVFTKLDMEAKNRISLPMKKIRMKQFFLCTVVQAHPYLQNHSSLIFPAKRHDSGQHSDELTYESQEQESKNSRTASKMIIIGGFLAMCTLLSLMVFLVTSKQQSKSFQFYDIRKREKSRNNRSKKLLGLRQVRSKMSTSVGTSH